MSEPQACLMCQQPVGPARPGATYNAVASNGMRLEQVAVCHACAARVHDPATCVHCHRPIGADRPASRYDAVSASGRSVHGLTVCHACAIPLGPRQHLTQTLKDEIAERNRA